METEKKVVISLEQLNILAGKLPNINECKDRSRVLNIGKLEIKFERIKYKNSEGDIESRWSYKGRIVVENKK